MQIITKKENPKILLVALSGIGNLVMQLPAIRLLKNTYSKSHITVWVAPRGTKALAEHESVIDEVWESSPKGSITHHINNVVHLRKQSFDIGIVLSPGQLIKSALYLFLANIPTRIGATYPFRGNPNSSFLLTHAVEEQEGTHDVEQNINILESLGIKSDNSINNYPITLSENEIGYAKTYVADLHLTANILIGIHAGSAPDFLWKRWPLENFAKVAGEAHGKYRAAILLFGGPDEYAQNEELKRILIQEHAVPEDFVVIVKEKLLATAAIIKQCTVFISNDSGLMHIAASQDIEVIGLFGPTDERLTGPRGEHAHVLRAENTAPEYNTENQYKGDKGKPASSILAITPDMVLTLLASILSRKN